MASTTPQSIFTASTHSARQLQLLLRCISFSPKAQVRISSDGLRFSTEEGSAMEAFVFLSKDLFTSYKYHALPPPSSQDDAPGPPVFQISLTSLLETLNIFSLSDPNSNSFKKPGDGYDGFTAHRLNRHAGINAFSSVMSGICTFSYDGEGSALCVHMSESGVTTTCELTTYEPASVEDIPFDRDAIALKTIMRSAHLLDAVTELSSTTPSSITVLASPHTRAGSSLSFSASGALGSATVDFVHDPLSESAVLETFNCSNKTSASYNFGLIRAPQRAMAAATKVSLRMDEEGVLSLQFLVEVDAGQGGDESVAFVDFRIVPLIEGEGDARDGAGSETTSEEN